MNAHVSCRAVKILEDKIEGGPPHVLSRQDVRFIFKIVPQEWTKEINEVRLLNSLEWHSHPRFSRYDGCLNIYSRNKTKRQALTTLLFELAAISLRLDWDLRRRPKSIRVRLNKMTAPYLQQLLPLISPPNQVKGHVSFKGFKEIRFPLVPNDIE
jgi:hypothetical protein